MAMLIASLVFQIDLPNRCVTRDEAQLWCQEHDLPYFETSAKDNTGVEMAFTAAVKEFKERESKMDSRQTVAGEVIDLRTKKSTTKSGCC